MAVSTIDPNGLNIGQIGGTRNKIINGAMTIDQRNAGASVSTSSGTFVYTLDRWLAQYSQTSKYTVQQNAGSVTPPTGFASYLGAISIAATAVGSSDYFQISQRVEGFNTADLAWGSSGAQPVTLSFWVRSSLTGTFGGALKNAAQNRSYPFTYAVFAADTWEQKTIAVVGDTSGTWQTTTSTGIEVVFSLGMGSTFSGTAGAWAGSNLGSATGATSIVGTSGATFYITGVQLEAGDTATPFEHRSYGAELALCQRYFEKSYNTATAPATATYVGILANGGFYAGPTASYGVRVGAQYKVSKRATPTVTTFDSSGNAGKCNFPDASTNVTMTVIHNGENGFTAETAQVSTDQTRVYWHYTSSAEL